MAETVQVIKTCDQCDESDLPQAQATTGHTLAIDGGPPKLFHFCPPHERALQPLLDLYASRGIEQGTKEPPKVVERKKQVAPAAKAKEVRVVCPLDHEGKGPTEVGYRNRASHADMVHDQAKLWDIPWQFPADADTVLCTAHRECKKSQTAFLTERGRAQHIAQSPLERIDQ